MDAQQTKIYTAILITTFLVGSILIYFIVVLIRQQRRNAKLYHLKILAEITTLENERMRISSDLHDELGPLLSAIKFKLSSIEISNAEDEKQMMESSKYLNDIIIRMREISNNLMPSTLLRKGLTVAVDEFVHNMPESTGLKINFKHGNIPELVKEKEINIYRIIQEIVHNTIKHAKAAVLNIELNADAQKIVLLTGDNGKGFDYSLVTKENTGLGLRNLLSRTDIMGGNLYIDSKIDKGTNYTIEIPI